MGKYGTYMGHIRTYGKYLFGGVRVKTILPVIFIVIFNGYLNVAIIPWGD